MTTGRINQVTNKSIETMSAQRTQKHKRDRPTPHKGGEERLSSSVRVKDTQSKAICSVSQRVIEVSMSANAHAHHIAKCSGFHQHTIHVCLYGASAVPYSFSSFELFLEAARRRKTHSLHSLHAVERERGLPQQHSIV
jgi:hypothetical protein